MAVPTKIFLTVLFIIFLCAETKGKISKNDSTNENFADLKTTRKSSRSSGLGCALMPNPSVLSFYISDMKTDGASLLFADELKMTLDKYLFGICPQTFKMQLRRNGTGAACDLDVDQQELAGRFATLALRAHSAARSDCSRFGAALANTLGELARTAANRQAVANANNEANKKRKLSKSQKAKLQAKQRTALAVKKKAAAVAAAAAAKITAS